MKQEESMEYTAMTLATTPHKDNFHPASIPFGPIAIIVVVIVVANWLFRGGKL